METKLDEILDGLEPFRDFINKLRQRKRTCREIAQILQEKCHLRVSKSTVHRFLQARSRQRRKASRSLEVAAMKTALTEINPPVIRTADNETIYEVRRRIEELKSRPAPPEPSVKEFQYGRDEPLHLVPTTDKNKSSPE
jgi:hypothetical protein